MGQSSGGSVRLGLGGLVLGSKASRVENGWILEKNCSVCTREDRENQEQSELTA